MRNIINEIYKFNDNDINYIDCNKHIIDKAENKGGKMIFFT